MAANESNPPVRYDPNKLLFEDGKGMRPGLYKKRYIAGTNTTILSVYYSGKKIFQEFVFPGYNPAAFNELIQSQIRAGQIPVDNYLLKINRDVWSQYATR